MVHRRNNQWKGRSEDAPQESIRSNSTRRILLESIDEIVERRLEDSEEPNAHHGKSNTRGDPREPLVSSPAGYEHATCKEDRSYHHGRKSSFWNSPLTCLMPFDIVQLLVVHICGTSKPCANKNGDKWKRPDNGMPAAAFLEDDWNRAKLEVQYSVAEASVKSHEEAYRGSQQLERPN